MKRPPLVTAGLILLVGGWAAVSIASTQVAPNSQPSRPNPREVQPNAAKPIAPPPSHANPSVSRPATPSNSPSAGNNAPSWNYPKPAPTPGTDEDAIGAVKALFAALTKQPGEKRDWGVIKGMFLPVGTWSIIIPTHKPGESRVVTKGIEDHAKAQIPLGENPFSQAGLQFRVERFGNQAQVWCSYEIRATSDPTLRLVGRGIASVQLVRDQGVWLILSAMMQPELDATPIPDKYLSTGDNAAQPGDGSAPGTRNPSPTEPPQAEPAGKPSEPTPR